MEQHIQPKQILDNIYNIKNNITKENFEWKQNLQLTKHFIERFNERYTDKFDKEDIEKILKEESKKWKYITVDKTGTEFWHKDRKQCYLYDTKNNRLTTTYYLDYQGFEDEFGKQMIDNMFNKLENLKEKSLLDINLILEETISKINEIEKINLEIEILNKNKNILLEELKITNSKMENKYSEIDKLSYFIVKNRNYQMEQLRTKNNK